MLILCLKAIYCAAMVRRQKSLYASQVMAWRKAPISNPKSIYGCHTSKVSSEKIWFKLNLIADP